MILGFGKKDRDDEIDDDEADEDLEYVLFQGAFNDKEANLAANARLAEAGLVPVKELITDALLRRAQIVRLEPKGKGTAITFSVDGVWYPGGRMMNQQALALTQMMKLLAGLDIKQRKKPQKGGVKAELQGVSYELHVECTPSPAGPERLIVRAVNLKEQPEKPSDLGITDTQKEKIRSLMSDRRGALLVCGPPRSGVTSATLGVLWSIDAFLYSILSIADVESSKLHYATPFEPEPDEDLRTTFERVFRMEADVLFTDPIRSAETAQILFAMLERVAILTEFAAKDAAHGIMQLDRWLGDPQLLARGLTGIFSQKLVRLLCDKCKEAYRPNPKMVVKVGLPPETKVLYRPRTLGAELEADEEEPEPCSKCGDIGYRGRAGLFEFIEMTDAMREVVSAGPTLEGIKAQVRKEKMPTFQKEGLRLVAEGKTSLEELQRVFKAK